jgi:acetyl-CoA carboxylase carboxyl transferase subunit alpha
VNLREMFRFRVPILVLVVGEGGSGGALGIGVGNRVLIMENAYYSVITPEGCAAILWNDPAKVEQATKALKITPDELLKMELIDAVIDEPLIGAHRDKEGAAKAVGEYFLAQIAEMREMDKAERMRKRYEKMMSFGAFAEPEKKE